MDMSACNTMVWVPIPVFWYMYMYEYYTAWPRQKDLSDIAALSPTNYTIYIMGAVQAIKSSIWVTIALEVSQSG